MATAVHAITNEYNACHLIKLDTKDRNTPFVVVQEAYDPRDLSSRQQMYYLQRDGLWIDEIACTMLPDSELDLVVYETSGDALEVVSHLVGKPMIRRFPVSAADVQEYVAKMKSIGSPEAAFHRVLARYRAAKERP
jgi:hypothetical protein